MVILHWINCGKCQIIFFGLFMLQVFLASVSPSHFFFILSSCVWGSVFFSNISQTLVCWLRQQVLTSYVNGFGHFTSYILHLGERTRSWYVLLLAYTSNYWFFIYYIILKVSYSLEFEFNVLSSWIHKTLVLVIKSFLQTSKIGHRSTFFKSITSCFHW